MLEFMIEANVRLVGVLRGVSGKSSITVKLREGDTIATLIQRLSAEFSEDFKRVLVDSEQNDPRPNVLILVNGREIELLQKLETRLEDDDVVTIIPVSHGG